MRLTLLFTALLLVFAGFSAKVSGQTKKGSFYELKIYHLDSKKQENLVELYLKDAFIPTMHRNGVKTVGVFKLKDTTQNRKIYVLVPYKSIGQYAETQAKLKQDKDHAELGKSYLEAPHNNAPYKRIEAVLMNAFSHMPNLKVPPFKNDRVSRVYELRSYEASTERISKNKIEMFNEGGELGIFNRLGFNAVFYGEVISGSRMPNLMYMTSFESQTSRDAHWKAFGDDPEWKKLSANPSYRNNVSKIDIVFLHPTEYSDF